MTVTKLLIASTNAKKLKELRDLLADLSFEVVGLADFLNIREVPEDGATFEENAVAKASGYAQQTGLLTLAEDSGLCCDALDGAPGIYSARLSGLEKDDAANNLKVLRLMEKMPDNCRGAHFKSAVAIADPNQVFGVAAGEVHGFIYKQLSGSQGFGYDALFYYPPFGKTFGEVPAEMKYQVSHRFKALQKARIILETLGKAS